MQELKDYLKNKDNKVMTGEEMKKKGSSQRGLGSYVPAHLNESPFFEDNVPQNPDSVKRKFSHKADKRLPTHLASNPIWARLLMTSSLSRWEHEFLGCKLFPSLKII